MATNSQKHLSLVITTIQEPTVSVLAWLRRFESVWQFVAIGDRKGPLTYDERVDFCSIDDQKSLNLKLPELLPENHYSRKNIGYLIAMKSGAKWIVDTDDDNAPLPHNEFKPVADVLARVGKPADTSPWINIYRYFTDTKIWPRGFPLSLINQPQPPLAIDQQSCYAPIQQHLVNLEPDVDAIWRLVSNEKITFAPDQHVYLPPGSYCPFNSQATFFHQVAFPLMYIPSTCSMRTCDILRSFVALRCLNEEGIGVLFSSPGFAQSRNDHNLMSDFESEIFGFLNNERVVGTLESTKLIRGNYSENLRLCYSALVKAELLDASELTLVGAWIEDIESCLNERQSAFYHA